MKLKAIAIIMVILASVANFSMGAQPLKIHIFDADNRSSISSANVSLLKSDSTFITNFTTPSNGFLEVDSPISNPVIMSISYLGYETKHIIIDPSTANDTIQIPLKQAFAELNEVTIKARSILTKDDKKIFFPTKELLNSSLDGADVVRKMQLPRIMVDPVSGEVTMSGNGIVQLRINGVQATTTEISAIPSTDIVRIEYYDDPGARYGNANAVINYITHHNEYGSNLNGVFFNGGAYKKASFDNRISYKYNYKKSEFAANASFIQRRQDWTREYDEKLFFPDYEIHRVEVGIPTLFNKKVFSGDLHYSLVDKDKYFLNIQFRYTRNDFPNGYEDRKSNLYISDSDTPIAITNRTIETANSPALDVYFQHSLHHNQLLIFNAVGTYIGTNSKRNYYEMQDSNLTTDIHSIINGDKYSLILEGIYEKKWGENKISGGLNHLQTYTNNEYSGTVTTNVSMHQSESSLYAEYQGRTGKLGYMASVTGKRMYYEAN